MPSLTHPWSAPAANLSLIREVRFTARPGAVVPAAMKARVLTALAAWVEQARAHVSKDFPAPNVSFDLNGSCAGEAYSGLGLIRLNPVLLLAEPDTFEKIILPHELGHLLAHYLHGDDISPHGAEWAAVMRLLGVEPRRHHSIVNPKDVGGYACSCNDDNRLTYRQHQKARTGQVYCCVECHGPLTYRGVAAVAAPS